MTIAAAYLTPEGVVLGADSTTTFMIDNDAVQMLNNAQKVFEVGQTGSGRMAMCTWGDGMIGEMSHRTIAAHIADRLGSETTVKQAAEILVDIVQRASGENHQPDVGYFLVGVDQPHTPSGFKVTFANGENKIDPLKFGMPHFEGVTSFYERVWFGVDFAWLDAMEGAMRANLGDSAPSNFSELFTKSAIEGLNKVHTGCVSNLPLRDVIDLLHTILHLTIKIHRFRIGPPICGGEIELGFVSTDRPFRWVCHKGFDSAI